MTPPPLPSSSSSPASAAGRRRLPAEQRREQLLDAAAALIEAHGPEALTMEGLAARAGVSKGLGYAYFPDAEGVALALWDREVAAIHARIEAASADAPDLEQALRRAVVGYFDIVAERGALLGALRARFGGREDDRRARMRLGAFLEFWAGRVQAAVPMHRAAATTLAGMILSAADVAARGWGSGALARDEAEELCMGFMFEGLRGMGRGRA